MDSENSRGVRRGDIFPDIQRGLDADHDVLPLETGQVSVPLTQGLHTSGKGRMQTDNAQYFPDFQSFPDEFVRSEWELPSLTGISPLGRLL